MPGLKNVREKYNYTPFDAAEEIGIPSRAYSRIEDQKWPQDRKMLKKTLDHFGISLDYIYGECIYGKLPSIPLATRHLCTPRSKIEYRMARVPWEFSDDEILEAIQTLDELFSGKIIGTEQQQNLERFITRGYIEILPQGMEKFRNDELEKGIDEQYGVTAQVYNLSQIDLIDLRTFLLAIPCAQHVSEKLSRPPRQIQTPVLAITNGRTISQVLQLMKPPNGIKLFPLVISHGFYDLGFESRTLAAELFRRFGEKLIDIEPDTEHIANYLRGGKGIDVLLTSFGGIENSMFAKMLEEHAEINQKKISSLIAGDMLYWPIPIDESSDKAQELVKQISGIKRPIGIIGGLEFKETLEGVQRLAKKGNVIGIACGKSKSDITRAVLKKYLSQIFLDDELARVVLNAR